MAQKTMTIDHLLLKNAAAATWTEKNPTLSKGEMGIEIDTHKFKFGDGVKAWNDLDYASAIGAEIHESAPTTTDADYDIGTLWINTVGKAAYVLVAISDEGVASWNKMVTPSDLASLGAGDMLKSVYDANDDGVVDRASSADKLTNSRDITLTGDATGTGAFDGSADTTITVVLKASGVTAGTYTKLTVNDKGIVTAAEQIAATDIPDLTLSKITDAGTAAAKDVGVAAGNVPVLDDDGKLNTSVIPSLAISEISEVADEAAMLALEAQPGDVAVRTDENKTYMLKAAPASTLANWVLLRTPTDAVLSVNGKTGAVTLTTDDVSEGSTNLYYTETRATDNFTTNFAAASSTSLADTANIIYTSDTLILDCGNAD